MRLTRAIGSAMFLLHNGGYAPLSVSRFGTGGVRRIAEGRRAAPNLGACPHRTRRLWCHAPASPAACARRSNKGA